MLLSKGPLPGRVPAWQQLHRTSDVLCTARKTSVVLRRLDISRYTLRLGQLDWFPLERTAEFPRIAGARHGAPVVAGSHEVRQSRGTPALFRTRDDDKTRREKVP